MLSAIVIEIVLTCGFLLVIHGATDKHAPAGFAPSPSARADPHPFDQHSSHQHLGQPGAQHRGGNFPGGWALQQLWLFWVMPIVGGILGGVLYRTLLEKRD